jgi:pimeloyl-ACP methyl ester carboxylesterase
MLVLAGAPFAGKAQFPAGKIIDSVPCRADAAQSYALYIPAKRVKAALPAVYFFDSHGAGSLPLRKYRALADAYGFILIGSNNSKNGNDWSTTEMIWRRLSEDTRQRLKIDGARVYTAGFSGGAKVASFVAIQHPEIKGVVANGAGLPDGVSAGDFAFSMTTIAGEGDMNMTDLVALDGELDKTRTRHRILFFDGKHEWAPENTMRTAFTAWQLDAMEAKLIPRDEPFINGWMAKNRQQEETYERENKLIRAWETCRLAIHLLQGLNDAAWFKQKAASLEANAVYRKQREQEQSLLVTEQNTKADYVQHFQTGDKAYWTRTIDGLRANAVANSSEGAMYQRLIAYLSLAFYSISNQLIQAGQNEAARHFSDLYKMDDPTNSEAWYFSAILDAREGNVRAAERDLQTAVRYGFNDRRRLRQQTEFKQMKIDFSGLESKMHP